MPSLTEGEKIGEMSLRGEVNKDVLDMYRDIKYKDVAEQDLNNIINCLSGTKYGKELADICRGQKVLISIRIGTDPK